ncbi:hypothetical protein [Mucilaginibacter jinjuensis]|uniref:Uncharacterized protein n=1 Tax=Mucilaginibacter jinjuensis TaxID=1176721 RepID=A0ABY7T9I8_9SPHI|nr:hypothetical protein [Mucilaginibacter jinjuensis]WCT12898.1 hypothetical protein PQO05_02985 [Mucilaginibacter jinjuensis]
MDKKASYLSGFYLLSLGMIVYFNHSPSFKSGPCTPNLDFFSFFLFGAAATLLFLISLIKLVAKEPNKSMLIINSIAALGWWGYLIIGSLLLKHT